MKQKVLQSVIDHVCDNASFNRDAPFSFHYSVRYKGKIYAADDTHALVKKIMHDQHPRASIKDY
jgi:hypothetical protein